MHRLTCSQKCNCPSRPCAGIREQQLALGPLPLLTSNFALNFLLLPLYDSCLSLDACAIFGKRSFSIFTTVGLCRAPRHPP